MSNPNANAAVAGAPPSSGAMPGGPRTGSPGPLSGLAVPSTSRPPSVVPPPPPMFGVRRNTSSDELRALARSVSTNPFERTKTSLASRKGMAGRWWLSFKPYGTAPKLMQLEKNEVKRLMGIPARDLRLLEPSAHSPASILVRAKSLVINFEQIHMIVSADEALLLVSGENWRGDDKVCAFADDLTLKVTPSQGLDDMPGMTTSESFDGYASDGEAAVQDSAKRRSSLHIEMGHGSGGGGALGISPKNVTLRGNGLLNHQSNADVFGFPSRDGRKDGYSSDSEWRQGSSVRKQRNPVHFAFHRRGGNRGGGGGGGGSSFAFKNYFEFRVLECVLETVCRLQNDETSELETIAYPALDALTVKVTRKNLEVVRKIKVRMTRLSGRVQQVRDELEHILDNDDDMAEMYLTRKIMEEEDLEFGMSDDDSDMSDDNQTLHGAKSSFDPVGGGGVRPVGSDPAGIDHVFGSSVESARSRGGAGGGGGGGGGGGAGAGVSDRRHGGEREQEREINRDHQELEDMLEAFNEQANGSYNRLNVLRDYIDDTEDFVGFAQDNYRNTIIQLDLLLTSATLCITLFTAISSLFGMNVPNGLENHPTAFFGITGSGLVTACALMVGSVWYFKGRGIGFF